MRSTTLAISRDTVTIGTFVKTDSPHVVEILGTTAMDFGIVDAEHAPFDRAGLDRLMLAGRAWGFPLLVRVADFSAPSIQTALDVDAAGILVPHVDSAQDAATVVSRARFRGGVRGLSISARFADYGAMPRAQAVARGDATRIVVQIESEAALNAVEAIAAVPGVDALFIGRADLAMSMGIEDPRDARILEASRHIVAATLRAGKVASMNAASTAEAAGYAGWGVSCFVIGSDQSLMRSAAQAAADPEGKGLRAALVRPE
jgi:2-keto-3-deoxy-L-rhamnonate aldolase RhmA